MYTNQKTKQVQQNFIRGYANKTDAYSFFNLLTSDVLFAKMEGLLPKHRKRLYPPTEILSMFLAQTMNADSLCQSIVNQAALQRLHGGVNTGNTHTGGYCRARQRLPLEMVCQLT